ncbi:MAG: substrate-binding domain-containing protein, partial [Hyphomicrobiaceae bacterium]
LGIRLFERAHRTSFLTAKGEELLPYAERLLGVMGEINRHVARPGGTAETVRVGISELIAVTWLSDLSAAIAQRYPKVSLRFDVDLIFGLTAKLRERRLDLVLCAGPLDEPDLSSVSLGSVRLGWFASPRIDLPGRRLAPSDLAQVPIISLSPNSSLHTMAMAWFERAGLACPRTHFCTSMNAVSLLVRAGHGLSILPSDYYEPYVETGTMRLLETRPTLPSIEYLAVYYPARSSTIVPAIARLAADVSLFRLRGAARRTRMRQKLHFSEVSQGAPK